MTRVLVASYSAYGHVFQLARAEAEAFLDTTAGPWHAGGGSQYGAATVTGPGAVKDPDPRELETARKQGARVARAAVLLRPLREPARR